MSNPYVSTKTLEPIKGNAKALPLIATLRSGKEQVTNTPLVASNGDINASNNTELLAMMHNLMIANANGDIAQESQIEASAKKAALGSALRAAYLDSSGPNFSIIGEEIANTVRDTAARAGFLRRFFKERELTAGETGKIRMRRHQVNAFSLGPNSTTVESRHNGRYMFPEEEIISARPIIPEKDLYSEGMGLLDEKSDEALEAIMAVEDRGMKALFDAAVGITGNSILFPTFTPAVFNNLKLRVQNTGGIPVEDCWISNSLWSDIIGAGGADFGSFFDPISKHELALTGRVGRLMDVNLHTDTFLESRLKVLDSGEIYFVGRSDFLGEVLVRQPITSSEIDGTDEGQAWRGWFLRQILLIGLGNNGGVSRGAKV